MNHTHIHTWNNLGQVTTIPEPQFRSVYNEVIIKIKGDITNKVMRTELALE